MTEPAQLTTSDGAPVGDMTGSLTVGPTGPMLISDSQFIEEICHFNREKIPERNVHARGAGAFGTFVVTNDVTTYTKASLFSSVGKQTKTFVRFSTIALESGSQDTVRDFRGMAVKLYTDEGNLDFLCLSSPVFPINDPIKFTSLNHATKRHPRTHTLNPDTFWDFMTLNQESANAVMHVFSDSGIPDGYRYMETYGCHAFKLVNAAGDYVYCKFQFTPNLGERFLTSEKATELAGTNPDYASTDLYNAIENGDFPSWSLQVQIMTKAQAEALGFYLSDITKEWNTNDFPLQTIGVLTLDKNPDNYFEYVEQSAFAVKNLVPGIEEGLDRVFQARMFAYPDAQRARMGPNFTQLKVNRATVPVANYQQDGLMTCHYQVGPTNYYPNTTGGPQPNPIYKTTVYNACGDVDRYPSFDDDYFSQPREFYQSMEEDEKERTVENLAASISKTRLEIQGRAIEYCTFIDPDLGDRVAAKVALLTAQ